MLTLSVSYYSNYLFAFATSKLKSWLILKIKISFSFCFLFGETLKAQCKEVTGGATFCVILSSIQCELRQRRVRNLNASFLSAVF